MTRYYALTLKTLDMGHVPPHESNPWGRYEVVMADEADAAISELREILRDGINPAIGMTPEWYARAASVLEKYDG